MDDQPTDRPQYQYRPPQQHPQAAYQGPPPPGYPNYPPYMPYQVPRPTNTMAILALIFAFVFCPLGIVFGVIAKKEIRRTGEGGEGLALAGIWVGSVFCALTALMIVAWFVLVTTLITTIPTPAPFITPTLTWLLRAG